MRSVNIALGRLQVRWWAEEGFLVWLPLFSQWNIRRRHQMGTRGHSIFGVRGEDVK